mmetsp:Transcript_86812/g.166001  ORF Transcript_86812/g.166001 Transcript_86812/m.166001 type:complete len:871 (-) Transcript_86812:32-2644(-)
MQPTQQSTASTKATLSPAGCSTETHEARTASPYTTPSHVTPCSAFRGEEAVPVLDCSNPALTLADLQQSLQSRFTTKGQTFHMFSISGAPVLTDEALRGKMAKGSIPLLAMQTDATLHEIVNRRDELAQMQLKLLRGQVANLQEELATCSSHIAQLRRQVNGATGDHEMDAENVNSTSPRENDHTARTLSGRRQRLDNALHVVTELTSKRELGLQHVSKNVQDLRTACDMAAAAVAMEDKSEAEDSKMLDFEDPKLLQLEAQMKVEQKSRQIWERQHDEQIQDIRRNLDMTFKQYIHVIVEKLTELKESSDSSQLLAQRARTSANSRLLDLERRCSSVEARLLESLNINTTNVEGLREKQEDMTQKFEHFKIEQKSELASKVGEIVERVGHLESEKDENSMLKDEPLNEEELHYLSQGFSEQHARQLADIEQKIAEHCKQNSDLDAIVSKMSVELENTHIHEMAEDMPTTTTVAKAKTLSETSTRGGSMTMSSPSSSGKKTDTGSMTMLHSAEFVVAGKAPKFPAAVLSDALIRSTGSRNPYSHKPIVQGYAGSAHRVHSAERRGPAASARDLSTPRVRPKEDLPRARALKDLRASTARGGSHSPSLSPSVGGCSTPVLPSARGTSTPKLCMSRGGNSSPSVSMASTVLDPTPGIIRVLNPSSTPKLIWSSSSVAGRDAERTLRQSRDVVERDVVERSRSCRRTGLDDYEMAQSSRNVIKAALARPVLDSACSAEKRRATDKVIQSPHVVTRLTSPHVITRLASCSSMPPGSPAPPGMGSPRVPATARLPSSITARAARKHSESPSPGPPARTCLPPGSPVAAPGTAPASPALTNRVLMPSSVVGDGEESRLIPAVVMGGAVTPVRFVSI